MRDVVVEKLTECGIAHEIIPCEPEYADTAQFCERYGFSPSESVNTIIVAGKQTTPRFAGCAILADSRLDVNSRVRKHIGAKKASFAPGDLVEELTSMIAGGVTIVGLPSDWPVLVDPTVLAADKIVLGGGSRDRKIILDPAELNKIPELAFQEIIKV